MTSSSANLCPSVYINLLIALYLNYCLSVTLDPQGVARQASIDTGEFSLTAANTERSYTNHDTIVVDRTTFVKRALAATTGRPSSAQHVGGDGDTTDKVVISASVLVDRPELDVT